MKPLHQLLFTSVFTLSFFVQKMHAQCNTAFTYAIDQHVLSVKAIDSSKDTRHYWYFGDGSSANGTNSFNSYSMPGTYTVKHITYDSLHNCIDSSAQTIVLNYTATCTNDFLYQNGFPTLNRFTFFANPTVAGANVTSYTWKVNGEETSTNAYFDTTFPAGGKYAVCNTIETNTGCSAEYCREIIVPQKCNLHPSFQYTANTNDAKTLTFSSGNKEPELQHKWLIDDSGTNYGHTFDYSFSAAGSHWVTLYLIDSVNGCYDTLRKYIAVKGNPSDSCTAAFNYTPNPPQTGLMHFTAQSNQPVTSQTWITTPLNSSNDSIMLSGSHPSFNFPDTGYYKVSLVITTNTGCVKDTSEILHITKAPDLSPRKVSAYPNPASEKLVLSLDVKAPTVINISVYNSMGKLALHDRRSAQQGKNHLTIPLQKLPKGQYFIDIQYNDQHSKTVFQKL